MVRCRCATARLPPSVIGIGGPFFREIADDNFDGAALGQTVEAADANEAVRHVGAEICHLTLPDVDRALAAREFEVIAVLIGDAQFAPTSRLPLFPSR